MHNSEWAFGKIMDLQCKLRYCDRGVQDSSDQALQQRSEPPLVCQCPTNSNGVARGERLRIRDGRARCPSPLCESRFVGFRTPAGWAPAARPAPNTACLSETCPRLKYRTWLRLPLAGVTCSYRNRRSGKSTDAFGPCRCQRGSNRPSMLGWQPRKFAVALTEGHRQGRSSCGRLVERECNLSDSQRLQRGCSHGRRTARHAARFRPAGHARRGATRPDSSHPGAREPPNDRAVSRAGTRFGASNA